jgi:hypothetical protein
VQLRSFNNIERVCLGQLLLTLLCCAVVVSCAAGVNSQWIHTTNSDNTITLIKYTGSNEVVRVPGKIGGLPVTSISMGAFGEGFDRLTSVVIEDDFPYIDNQMFECCMTLTNVTIGSNVSFIGVMAFSECSSLPHLSLPDRVTSIEHLAFMECGSLTNLVLGAGITNIGNEVFIGCPNLRSLYFRGDAPNLGTNVFDGTDHVTVYHLALKKGWTNEFGGRPTKIWSPDH